MSGPTYVTMDTEYYHSPTGLLLDMQNWRLRMRRERFTQHRGL